MSIIPRLHARPACTARNASRRRPQPANDRAAIDAHHRRDASQRAGDKGLVGRVDLREREVALASGSPASRMRPHGPLRVPEAVGSGARPQFVVANMKKFVELQLATKPRGSSISASSAPAWIAAAMPGSDSDGCSSGQIEHVRRTRAQRRREESKPARPSSDAAALYPRR